MLHELQWRSIIKMTDEKFNLSEKERQNLIEKMQRQKEDLDRKIDKLSM